MTPDAQEPDPREVAHRLAEWFQVHRREMPWRDAGDPYRTLVSEVMLQQTQVDTVRDYYPAFLEDFPTVEALAAAPEEEVLEVWAGLGYYRRARNLHAAARRIVEDHGGEVPRDPDALRELPGVGPYTAGAVASIAFGVPEPAVDANAERVLARLLAEEGNVKHAAPRRRLTGFAREVLEAAEDPGDLTQALMELGSLVCRPTPRCSTCPLAEACAGRARGIHHELPEKGAPRRPTPVDAVAGVVWTPRGEVLQARAPEDGLLARTWGFPWTTLEDQGEPSGSDLVDAALTHLRGLGVEATPRGLRGRFTYTFSHRRWDLRVVDLTVDEATVREGPLRWVDPRELAEDSLPAVHRRVHALLDEPLQRTL